MIGGAWLSGETSIENRSPSDTSDLIGLYAQASRAQVDAAVSAAGRAQRLWAGRGLEQRATVLENIGRELIARHQELGRQLSREEGKPLAEGCAEVYRSGQFFTYFAAETLRMSGDSIASVRPGVEVDVRREPLGVVGVISPWNFPMATASWKIAPALAFGNAVIWKPANLTPASAWALAEIISRQDIPAGAFNLIMGSGSTAGQALAENRGVQGITFTGSLQVGLEIATAATARLTKLQMEMGAKNPLLVMEDADLELAVGAAISAAFGGSGQKCTAASRIIVHRKIEEAFIERFVQRAAALRVGHALEDSTQIGPVVSQEQLRSNLEYVALAQREGGERACGGEVLTRETEGFYMSPAVFLRTRNDMRINQEEMFAPIACVLPASDLDEAIAIANDTPFGLSAGIMTRSLAYAAKFRRESRSGCVMVNLPTAGTDYHVPFGGVRQSSFGPREQGRYAAEFYTQVKTSYVLAGEA
jgi:alpha-ketoglutaric semialdehyde dehydrogenase